MKLGTSPEQKEEILTRWGNFFVFRLGDDPSERAFEESDGGSCYDSAEASLNFVVLCCDM